MINKCWIERNIKDWTLPILKIHTAVLVKMSELLNNSIQDITSEQAMEDDQDQALEKFG